MKNIMKILIAFFSALLICLSFFLIYALRGQGVGEPFYRGYPKGFGKEGMIQTQTIDLRDIAELKINNYSSDVFFLSGDQEALVIKEYADGQYGKDSFVVINREGTTLKIESEERKSNRWFAFGNSYRYFEIYLPSAYRGSLNLESGSGDIQAETDLMFSNCSIQTSSGDISLKELEAEHILLKAESGDILAEVLNGEQELSAQSGEIDLSDSLGNGVVTVTSGDVEMGRAGGRWRIKTLSGDVQIDHLEGSAEIKTSSGGVCLGIAKLQGNLEISCSSGDVSCDLPEGSAFQFRADTDSGTITTNFDRSLNFDRKGEKAEGKVGENAEYSVNVLTTSGDIDFNIR